MNRSPNTEEAPEKKRFRLRSGSVMKMSVTLAAVGLAFLLLLGKIWTIQNDSAEDYNKIVLSQRQSEYVSQTIPARRGDIYDRNGNLLACSEKVYILILDPKQLIDSEARKDGVPTKDCVSVTCQALEAYFGLDAEEVKRTVEQNPSSSYIRLLKDVSYDSKKAFLEYQESQNKSFTTNKEKKKITGVWFEDHYKRSYPYGSLACSVIGFSSDGETSGTGGVEQYYNETLSGVNGREYGYLNDDADLEKVVKSAENGESLVLTIDATIQSIVEKYLAEWENGETGSKAAACIVMDPDTGEILAMAETGTFDLNDPITTGDYTQEEVYSFGLEEGVTNYASQHPGEERITKEDVPRYYTEEQIMNLGKVSASYRIWRNICISDMYEPGSTQKIFTVAGAIEEGKISPEATYLCDGHVSLSDGVNSWRINCVNRSGHGLLDVTGGITNSCNVVMMNIAFEEGEEIFKKYQKIFGFGEYTGIDLPAEADTSEYAFNEEHIGKTRLATNSFGQNYDCTMIQMASAYASVINGGHYYQPHVVKRVLSSDGTLIRDVEPTLVRETVSESTCDYLKSALFETVETGTGKAAQVEGYTVGGKTGTAQKLPRSAKTYVVSFCGFAPVEDPELLCYVIVDEPSLPGEEAAHSSFASGIFSKIMAEALPARGIYPEGTKASDYVAPAGRTSGQTEGEAGSGEDAAAAGETEEESTVPAELIKPAETDEFVQGEDEGTELPDLLGTEEGM